MIRCINLDWLEVSCIEAAENSAAFFEAKGEKVEQRKYGTPLFAEMFTVFYPDGKPFVEIRRAPYSLRQNGGIFEYGACHVRLSNEVCYHSDPVGELRAFLVKYGYQYKNIKRIDIALDFNRFDAKQKDLLGQPWKVEVQDFIDDYMKGVYSKVNQSNLHCHGTDRWDGRRINSLKWGSVHSPNTTKLYNKTQELKECGDKPYIRATWEKAGLNVFEDVWRIEFSLTSQFQTLRNKLTGEIVKKQLSDYDNRNKLLQQFFMLYHKYFNFRVANVAVSKYKCPRVSLMLYNIKEDIPNEPCRNIPERTDPTRSLKITCKTLVKMMQEKMSTEYERVVKEAILHICLYLHKVYRLFIPSDMLFKKKRQDIFKQMRTYISDNVAFNEPVMFRELDIMRKLCAKYDYIPIKSDAPF